MGHVKVMFLVLVIVSTTTEAIKLCPNDKKVITLPKGYDPNVISAPDNSSGPAVVSFSFGILQMKYVLPMQNNFLQVCKFRREIDEVTATLHLQMDLVIKWNDTRLLLEDPDCLGEVDKEKWRTLYRPNIYVYNTDHTRIMETVIGRSG